MQTARAARAVRIAEDCKQSLYEPAPAILFEATLNEFSAGDTSMFTIQIREGYKSTHLTVREKSKYLFHNKAQQLSLESFSQLW